jgi:hypothetical protein
VHDVRIVGVAAGVQPQQHANAGQRNSARCLHGNGHRLGRHEFEEPDRDVNGSVRLFASKDKARGIESRTSLLLALRMATVPKGGADSARHR